MLGFGHPRYSLKLGPRQATWAERSRDWRGRPHVRFRVVDLPPGLLTPSPVEPNVHDADTLKTHVRALIGLPDAHAQSSLPIALVLPDLCVRTVLLNVDTLPARPRERDALIRWRLDKEAAFPLAGARVVSQVVGPHTVLVALAGESVLRQYATLCDDLGLVPATVESASVALARLVRASSPGEEPAGCLSLLDDGFALVILHAGRPVFLRTKIQSPQVLDDLAASLALYEDAHPGAPLQRLALIGEGPESGLAPVFSKELGLDVRCLGGADLRCLWRAPVSRATPAVAVPAVSALAPTRQPDALPANFGSRVHAYLGRVCAALIAVSLLCAGGIAWDIREAAALREQAADVERAMARAQEQDRRALNLAQTEGVDLSDAVLARLPGEVAFANELIAKRAFSWTRFLGDLEDAVPPGVSIQHIRLDFKGLVITLGGSALSLKDLTALVISLEDHTAFTDANLLEHRVRETDVVDFSVTVRYQSQAQRM